MIIAIATEIWSNNPSDPDTRIPPGDSRSTTPIPSSSSLQPLSIVNLSSKPKDRSLRLPDTSFDFGTGYKRSGGPETTLELAKLERERERPKLLEGESFVGYLDRDHDYVEPESGEEEEEATDTVVEPSEPVEQEAEGDRREANVLQMVKVIDIEQEMDVDEAELPVVEEEIPLAPASDKILAPLVAPILEFDEYLSGSTPPRIPRDGSPLEVIQIEGVEVLVQSASELEKDSELDQEIQEATFAVVPPHSLLPSDEEENPLDDLWGDDSSSSPSSLTAPLPSALDSTIELPFPLPLPVVNSPLVSDAGTNSEQPLTPQITTISSEIDLETISQAPTDEHPAISPLPVPSSSVALDEIVEPPVSSIVRGESPSLNNDLIMDDTTTELPVSPPVAIVPCPPVPDAGIELPGVSPSPLIQSLALESPVAIPEALREATITQPLSPDPLTKRPSSPPVSVVSLPLSAEPLIEQPPPLLPSLTKSLRENSPDDNALTSLSKLPLSSILLASTFSPPPLSDSTVQVTPASLPSPPEVPEIVWGSSDLPPLVPSAPSFGSPIDQTMNSHDRVVFEPVFTPISVSIPDLIARNNEGGSSGDRIRSESKVYTIDAEYAATSSGESFPPID